MSSDPRSLGADALDSYRLAVERLLKQVGELTETATRHEVETCLLAYVGDEDLQRWLRLVPGGAEVAFDSLAREVHGYRPSTRSSASDLLTMIRIFLLSQIDAAWWGDARTFETDSDVACARELVDLDPLRRRGLLRFRYRRQPVRLPGRARDWTRRHVAPTRQPHTSGLRFTRARPESVALLNQLSADFSTMVGTDSPPLWVTSLVRSVNHQHRLRELGYSAVLPSAHCSGYAMDVEVSWFRQFGLDRALTELLLDRQKSRAVNVIDEGQAWHVCISPVASEALRSEFFSATPT